MKSVGHASPQLTGQPVQALLQLRPNPPKHLYDSFLIPRRPRRPRSPSRLRPSVRLRVSPNTRTSHGNVAGRTAIFAVDRMPRKLTRLMTHGMPMGRCRRRRLQLRLVHTAQRQRILPRALSVFAIRYTVEIGFGRRANYALPRYDIKGRQVGALPNRFDLCRRRRV